ncbi:hypothetical protein GIB67_028926, partial [Kingdonia uniflora]
MATTQLLETVVVVMAMMMMMVVVHGQGTVGGGTWCVAKSNVSEQILQTGLDYACGAGADCAPIQSNGLCYLPNTRPAHASYAFNSYYQRKSASPGACDFNGAATVAMSDPSYGSCIYPATASAAGATAPPLPPSPTTTITNSPIVPTPIGGGGGIGGTGGLTPGYGPGSGTNSVLPLRFPVTALMHSSLVIVLSLLFRM